MSLMNDYQKTITINKAVSDVYDVITEHISDWWSNDITGSAVNAGDSFTIAFGKTRKTFVISEAIPNKKITWKCIEAYIDMASLQNKSEWVGTHMTWTLSSNDQNTTIHFLHESLNKSMECYEICEAGWDQFLASLETYLLTGKGSPFIKKIQTTA